MSAFFEAKAEDSMVPPDSVHWFMTDRAQVYTLTLFGLPQRLIFDKERKILIERVDVTTNTSYHLKNNQWKETEAHNLGQKIKAADFIPPAQFAQEVGKIFKKMDLLQFSQETTTLAGISKEMPAPQKDSSKKEPSSFYKE